MKRQVISDSGAPAPMAHYCQGVVVGDHVYAAGQIASDYRTGVPPEARVEEAFPYYGSNIQRQTRYVLNRRKLIPDNPNIKGRQDRSRINTEQDYEVRYWTQALGVSEDELKRLVSQHGNSADAVRKALHK